MTWIQTLNGKLNLEDPQPDQIHLGDIAHALSQLCRFGGHTPRFYSVAEHSVLMVQWEIQQGETDHGFLGAMLLHDAAEAYTGDVLAPHRALADMKGFNSRARRIKEVVRKRFGLVVAPDDEDTIRHIDLRMLATERDFILGREESGIWIELPKPLRVPIQLWSPQEADAAFLALATMLELRERHRKNDIG